MNILFSKITIVKPLPAVVTMHCRVDLSKIINYIIFSIQLDRNLATNNHVVRNKKLYIIKNFKLRISRAEIFQAKLVQQDKSDMGNWVEHERKTGLRGREIRS